MIGLVPEVLTDLSDASLVRAIEENQWFAFPHFASPPVGEIHREPDRRWYRTGRDSFLLNGVLGARFPAEEVGERIEVALEPFRGLPMVWVTGPAAAPPDLGERLVARGSPRRSSRGWPWPSPRCSTRRTSRGGWRSIGSTTTPWRSARARTSWSWRSRCGSGARHAPRVALRPGAGGQGAGSQLRGHGARRPWARDRDGDHPSPAR